jgi:hypothetical protein
MLISYVYLPQRVLSALRERAGRDRRGGTERKLMLNQGAESNIKETEY